MFYFVLVATNNHYKSTVKYIKSLNSFSAYINNFTNRNILIDVASICLGMSTNEGLISQIPSTSDEPLNKFG